MPLKPCYKIVSPPEDLREGKPVVPSEFAVHFDQVFESRAQTRRTLLLTGGVRAEFCPHGLSNVQTIDAASPGTVIHLAAGKILTINF